jgi:uncharacterized protein YdbL (DUF1318 family)
MGMSFGYGPAADRQGRVGEQESVAGWIVVVVTERDLARTIHEA